MRSKKLALILLVLVLILSFAGQIMLAEELTGREIIERSQHLERVDDLEAVIKMEIIKDGSIREREMIMRAYYGDDGTERSLIRFTAPADVQGSGFLNIVHADGEEESWIYLPAVGRERRIISQERGESFMGSDFTYEDISQTIDDYEYELLDRTEIQGREVFKIKYRPVTQELVENVEFSHQIAYIDVNEFYVLKVEYFDAAGEKIRLLTGENVKQIGENLYQPTILTMENLKTGRKTVLTYKEIAVNVGFSADDFSRRQLTRPLN